MAIQITQPQYNTAIQTIRNLHIKINILDFNYNILDSVEGDCIDGQIEINANSDLRRTCSVSFVVTDSSYEIQAGGAIFLDKLIQIYIGVDEILSGEIVWTNMGMFLINQPSYTYNATNHTISFDGVDLMAMMTGLRNGYIAELASEDVTAIPIGSNVRNAIIAILTECGFTRYLVSECINYPSMDSEGNPIGEEYIQEVPYDMEFEQGSTWYDVLKGLVEILPYYQIYFDADGVFHYELIPSFDSDPVMIDDTIWAENVISEEISVDFEGVKNAVEVYGAIHETEYYSDSTVTTISGTAISLVIEQEYFSLIDYVEVGFTLPSAISGDNITINVNSLGAYALVNADGTQVTALEADTYYIIYFDLTNQKWIFQGHLQAQGYWEDNNPESPFYVNSSIGKMLIPLYGDEYENIQSDDLALQRARYEIYKRCRLNDTINLQTTPIYWADVNWKVSITSRNETEAKQYMVQSININLSYNGTQSWELSRFYPLYPVIS